jgi:cysteinyl-tRNA synthetase
MEWDSPWGRGFPGWHIECSAMSMKYLGDEFDIHTGGSDHIPVHHTNEIAQSEAATGHAFVHYWLHGEHLVLGEDERMGKSEGNLVLLDDLMARGYEPLSFRYLALNNHYRKYLQFSWQALKAADTALMGLRRLLVETGLPAPDAPPPAATDESTPAGRLLADLADDLNTPKALATLWTVLRDGAVPARDKVALAVGADTVLSLSLFDTSRIEAAHEVPPEIQALAQARWDARGSRNFAEADRLRDEIQQAGYVVRDGKDGFEVVKA